MELEPWERLDRPISTDNLRDTLDQLVTAGVRPLQHALGGLTVRRFHRSIFLRSARSIAIMYRIIQ
jgi:hypothetical protein